MLRVSSSLPYAVPLFFGQKTQPGTALPQPARFQDLADIPDPKPKKTFSFKHALFALAGLGGFWYGPAAVDNLHTMASARVSQMGEHPSESLPGKILDGVAQVDHTLYHTPMVGSAEYLYTKLIAWEAGVFGLLTALMVRKKRLKPADLFAELNKRGLTGEGVKYAVIDTGTKPVGAMASQKFTFYNPTDLSQPAQPFQLNGHGTAVHNIMAEANPGSISMHFVIASSEQATAIDKEIQALFEAAKSDPSQLTLEALRKIKLPLVQNFADSLKKAVDEGAKVINLSLDPEQGVRLACLDRFIKNLFLMPVEVPKGLLYRWTLNEDDKRRVQQEEKVDDLFRLTDRLGELWKKNDTNTLLNDAMKASYQPWLEALDYAHAHGAKVVVGAGNSGGHKSTIKNALGYVNPLAMFPHPALFVAASTDSDGVISSFTSEYNDTIQPSFATNGSGELSTFGPAMPRPLWKKILSPFGFELSALSPFKGLLEWLGMNNPPGTSFAAPNLSDLLVKMQQLDPTLTAEEAREILTQAAVEAKFSPKQEAALLKEIEEALNPPRIIGEHLEIDDLLEGAMKKLLETPDAEGTEAADEYGTMTVTREGAGARVVYTPKDTESDGPSREITLSEHKLSVFQESGLSWLISELIPLYPKKKEPLTFETEAEKTAYIQTVLAQEKKRRVGGGTLVGRHHAVIALTEARAMAKRATP